MSHQKITGHVEEISRSFGSEFSFIKLDNATRNFTNMIQRIAGRIAFDPNQNDLNRLNSGTSVITSVMNKH